MSQSGTFKESYAFIEENRFSQQVDHTQAGTSQSSYDELRLEHKRQIYGPQHVVAIFVPVIICISLVVGTISTIDYFSRDDGVYLLYTPFHPEETDSGGDTAVKSSLNALIMLGMVVVMTCFLILLYKARCYKVIHGWILLSSFVLLFLIGFLYMQEFLKALNKPVDIISITFLMYNFGVTGIIMIHWKGPLIGQQTFLIFSAALMSLVFIKYLPEWTLWLLLAVMAIWDLVAVLTPCGPLRILVETAAERGESIMPALIYSSTVLYHYVIMAQTSQQNSTENTNRQISQGQDHEKRQQQQESRIDTVNEQTSEETHELQNVGQQQECLTPVNDETPETFRAQSANAEIEEEKGVKLGLGDFIFYSILVGKASSAGDSPTIIACIIGILMGLLLTLVMLVMVKKALPALPISIFFGLIMNFSTQYLISPMVTQLSAAQIFL